MHKDPNRYISNCQNCGVPDLVYFYKHVLEGIALCDDCADMPFSKVKKNDNMNWVLIDDQYYPPDYRISVKI